MDYEARLQAYFEKAFREAKLPTSWLNPSEPFEQAVRSFVAGVVSDRDSPLFQSVARLAQRLAGPGYANSLSQLVLKCMLPGVPDFYQGCEYWAFRLVDPDNRVPVDFDVRRSSLRRLQSDWRSDAHALVAELRRDWSDALKQFVSWRALDVRQRFHDVLAVGDYRPLEVQGARAESLLAFARSWGETTLVTVVPRLTSRLLPPDFADGVAPPSAFTGEVWGDALVHLPDVPTANWTDQLTMMPHAAARREGIPVRDLLGRLPAALLLSTGGSS
jgi:(1->4)-alpha-D-glucan 1-alpha-D-glucosylmutase